MTGRRVGKHFIIHCSLFPFSFCLFMFEVVGLYNHGLDEGSKSPEEESRLMMSHIVGSAYPCLRRF